MPISRKASIQTGEVRKGGQGARPNLLLKADGVSLGYTKPGSYEEMRAVLSSGSVRLPTKLKQVATFLWQQPGEVALGNVTTVAKKAGVQPSTMVRFAQRLGYTGFSDFQLVFKTYLKGNWPRLREGGAFEIEPGVGSEAAELIGGFVRSSLASLSRLGESLDVERIDVGAQKLAGAELIYIIGSKRAFSATSYIALAMSKLGIRNILIDNVGSVAFEQLSCCTARDAVLSISFAPYNSITPDLTTSAAERGAAIVSLTDGAFSPLCSLSDVCLEVVEEEYSGFRSLAATLATGLALALLVARKRSSVGN